ncbi:TRAP transporter large permease [Sanguibacter antarcticus]|uniref:Tripartite ATP-independent transporter DctM subunit n=1 Tax=Sanguibacter antarcticus TaxID=372484 RepID=A0A2A9E5I1_9MICO|nr:TRAP transporter large permease [Sanguibacter antarcticus]PFG34218.1 tripartite ATP-independent transporter DctM subunit [Sanguibacter antarcticus]
MDVATLAALILVVGIFGLLILGAPISVAVGLSSGLAMVSALGFENGMLTSAQQMFRGINSFSLLAIPFFVLAGVIMNNGGIALRLINAAKVLVGGMPGSLAQTNVAANALFGAVSGSAVAAVAAVGSTMAPLQAKEGYDRNFAAATNIASAPSGMLIPPSNLMIVYSLVSSTSIAALFVAGYVPGLLWAGACMVIVYLYARKRPELKITDMPSWGVRAKTLLDAVPSLALIVVVIGGILAGFFTPTEASCIAVVYSLALSFIYRSVKVRDLKVILLDSARTTAIVMFLIGVSSIMSWVMSFAKIPGMVADAMFSLTDNPTLILLLIAVLLLVVGCFMDPTPAVLIFAPIFLPIVMSFGVDPVHFGIVMVFNLCIGTITPPVGPVLFVGAKVADLRIEDVVRHLVPFFVALVGILLLVMFVPQLSLWLPGILGLN